MTPTLSPLLASAARELANHLWQSTVFAAVIALLALALRNYQARARYWLWLAASVKFLVPFSLLIAAGSHLAWTTHTPQLQPTTYLAIDQISQPFTEVVAFTPPTIPTIAQPAKSHIPKLPTLLASLWLCGSLTVLASWLIQFRRISAFVHAATLLHAGREHQTLRRLEATQLRVPHSFRGLIANRVGYRLREQTTALRRPTRQVPILASPHSLEPGVFGLFHPVLLWPTAISAHLDDAHLEAVLAHELAHIQRRDNLTSALHMLVEAIFWFHPLVWYIERRLVDERERACDQAVLRLCPQPHVYAESILKVCELCLESPLPCVSGITGADLKHRIVQIMTPRIIRNLGLTGKLLLTAAALLVAAVPILLGQAKAAQRFFAQAPPPAPDVAPPAPVRGPRAVVPLLPTDSVPEQKIAFDVVSVKAHRVEDCNPRNPCLNRVELPTNGDGFAFRGATMYTVLHFAYGGNGRGGEWVVLGQPKWVDTDFYDIQGKVTEEDIPAWQKMGPDTKRIAVRELLRDMLKLKVHEDAKEIPIYALVVGKNGPKMKEYQPGDTVKTPDGRLLEGYVLRWFTPNELVCQAMDMDRLANSLNPRMDRPVLDRTGLTGLYNFTLEINAMRAPVNPTDSDPSVPSVFTSIQKLGLELKPAKGDPHNLVIDHIEKPPIDGAELTGPAPATLKLAAFVQEKPAQSSNAVAPYAPTLTFDVASIRESKPGEILAHGGGWNGYSEIRIINMPVHFLLLWAYGVGPGDISGLPDWAVQPAFNVHAKSDAAAEQKMATLDTEQVNMEQQHMVQTLLADRFNLKVHWGSREGAKGSVRILVIDHIEKPASVDGAELPHPPTATPTPTPTPVSFAQASQAATPAYFPADQMQKAIDLQATGNVDAAIQIYRQILNLAPSRQFAAQAQFHLAQALLQKGDLQGAAREFQILSQSYPEYKDLVASLAAQMRLGSQREYGSLKDGRFHHFLTDIELTIPDGYAFTGCGPSSGNGEQAYMRSQSKPDLAVWMRPVVEPIDGLRAGLREKMIKKPSERSEGWKERTESVRERTFSGKPGISVVADYTQNGRPWVEYLIWINTGKTHTQFYGQAPADQLPMLRQNVDTLANLAVIP